LTERRGDAPGKALVALCIPDNIGRLIGKRVPADLFDEMARRGMAMPDYHLVTGIENVPYGDLAVTGWHTGFHNGVVVPDPSTRFHLGIEPGTTFYLCDAKTAVGEQVAEAPRAVLRRQVERLATLGFEAQVASELEFYAFATSYRDAHGSGYRAIETLYHRHADNDILITGFAEPFLQSIREGMTIAGLRAVCTQGEGGIGQYEINTAPNSPLQAADGHAIFKHLVKATAQQAGRSVTFMAKPRTDQAGSGSHFHVSLHGNKGGGVLGRDGKLSPIGRRFLAGLLAYAADFAVLHAPYVNSYRRLRPGFFTPLVASWGWDNRTTMVRAIEGSDGVRFEFRLPGADVNPYFSAAAILAAGIEGIERALEPSAPVSGEVAHSSSPRLPRDLTEAIIAFASSDVARRVLGDTVHAHLVALAEHEREAARLAVTDWDLARGFEPA